MSKRKGSAEDLVVIVCRADREPEILTAPEKVEDWVRSVIPGMVESLCYPNYLARGLKGGELCVICDEEGTLKKLPVNRWGLIGEFVIVRRMRGRWKGFTRSTAESVVGHLKQEYGYFRKDSGVFSLANAGIGLYGPHLVSPEEMGEQWSPDLNFTDIYREEDEPFLNWLLWRYSRNIVSASLGQPHPRMYCIELQFGESEEDQEMCRECRRIYESSGGRGGKLKPALIERPPVVGLPGRKRRQ